MMTPDEAFEKLKLGNNRFKANKMQHPHTDKSRLEETFAGGQSPFATILTCSDSRTPPEFIFDQGIGDIFVVRVAGNVCDTDVLGSIELGVEHCRTSLVVVLGHRNCGLISMAVREEIVSDAVSNIIDKVRPVVELVRKNYSDLSEDELVSETAKQNARNAQEDIVNNSPLIHSMVQSGKVKVIAAYYDIENGEVQWLD